MRYSFKAKKIPVRWSHYRRATFVSVCLGAGLVIVLGFCNGSELFGCDWLIDLVACSGMIGHFLASSTYIARIIDIIDRADKPAATLSLNEKIELGLTIPFALVGLVVGIILFRIQHIIVTFFGILNNVVLFTLRAIGAYAGIGNRLGSLPRRPSIEMIALILFTFLGLGVGVFLFYTGGIACLSVPGVSTLITSSTIAKFLSIGYIASSYASAADYAAKAYRFCRAITNHRLDRNDETPEGKENTQIRERICEYAGSCFLALVGLLVAMLLLPHITSFWAATTVIISCVSIFGGIGSRLGVLADAYYEFEGIEDDISTADTLSTVNTPKSPNTQLASVHRKLASPTLLSHSTSREAPTPSSDSPETSRAESSIAVIAIIRERERERERENRKHNCSSNSLNAVLLPQNHVS